MNVHAFNDWCLSVTGLAAAILWQSTLLAGLVAVVCWLLRRSAPALRYWCWQIVAFKLLLMPWWIVTIPLSDFLGAGAAAISSPAAKTAEYRESAPVAAMDRLVAPPAGGVELAASETLGRLDLLGQLTWRSWLVIAWLGGIAWQLGRMLVQHGRLRRLLSRATPASESALARGDGTGRRATGFVASAGLGPHR